MLTAAQATQAADLTASDGTANNFFGSSTGLFGTMGLVGAYGATISGNTYQGAAYVYRNLDTAVGTVTENVKLTASDGAVWDTFGSSASLSGTTGLVGAQYATVSGISYQGAAYVYRNLDTAVGTVTENVKLTSSDGAAWDGFGRSASLSGTNGLVGASGATVSGHAGQGAAYVYRNLDTAAGTVTENAKLTASDGSTNDVFGASASLSGTNGLVGASGATVSGNSNQGAAYVYHNLDTAVGTVTENAKLTASDGAASDNFGCSASLSGTTGLVGAYNATVSGANGQGAAYVYRNLDTAVGAITENAKLTASDGARLDFFGYSASLSGTTGLVGAYQATVNGNSQQGTAYVYRNLDTAAGTVTENVKLTASDGATNDNFGCSVSLNGDQFVVGASGNPFVSGYTGKAYTGSVSSITTLDAGSTSKTISGISFVSREDWVVGKITSNNQVSLSAGDTADVSVTGKAVYIGQNAGSNNNTLVINGTLTANVVTIGSTDGNTGNALQLNSGAVFGPLTLELSTGNQLVIQGDYSNISNLLAYLGSSMLQTWTGGTWLTLTLQNYSGLITNTYSSGTGYTTIAAVPEASTCALFGFGALGLALLRRKTGTRKE